MEFNIYCQNIYRSLQLHKSYSNTAATLHVAAILQRFCSDIAANSTRYENAIV